MNSFLTLVYLVIFSIAISPSFTRKVPPPSPNSNDASRTQFHKNLNEQPHGQNGPLILTPLIKSGNLEDARNQAKVNHPDFDGFESYSGYLTVNETCGSNLFFWFIRAEVDPVIAPVLLWLQGGPGYSSLFGAVHENGPVRMLDNSTVQKANYSWSQYNNMLYIDNPVDVGYSFTKIKNCLPTEETRIGNELHAALVQFFQLFPELQKNDFFVTGESYAGMYCPATAYTIHKKNPAAEVKINLKGVIIGDGMIDTLNQHRYSPYLYELGLVDEDGRKQLEEVEDQVTKAIEAKDWEQASKLFIGLLFGGNGSLYNELTGLNISYNYVTGDKFTDPIQEVYFNRPDIKAALHTGDVEYVIQSMVVYNSLQLDIVKSVTPMLVELLNNDYDVLLYSGQLDIIVAYPLTRDFINQLEFKGKAEFKAAKRFIWQVEQEVAGYVREGGHLTLALVRNAGHMVPKDQPKWMMDLLLGFTQPKCITLIGNRRVLKENCKL